MRLYEDVEPLQGVSRIQSKNMREIISVQVGQCGNQVGDQFWDLICKEHDIKNDGNKVTSEEAIQTSGRTEVFFQELREGRFVPRTALIDLEPGPLDAIKGGPNGTLYRPDNFVYGSGGAGNNWATGFVSKGASKVQEIFDILRKEAEACDCLQGFQLFHSLGGGTGSGLGTLILNLLREEYPDRIFSCVSVLPSPKVSDIVVEPYNSLLAMDQLIEWSDEVFCMDNEALYNICTRNLKYKKVSYTNLNSLIAQTLSGVTTTLRFPGQLNSDLRKLAVNMIPFPRLHFFMAGLAPLRSKDSEAYYKTNVEQITRDLFEAKNIMCACNPSAGRYLTFAAMFRGNVVMRDVDDAIMKMQNKFSGLFVEWIPNNAKVSVCPAPPIGQEIGAAFLANNTALQDVMRRTQDQFCKMFKRKAFVHWYTNEGLDPLSFNEASSNLSDLIAEYQQYTEDTVSSKIRDENLDDSLEDLDSGFGL